jgi:hypothetical protein
LNLKAQNLGVAISGFDSHMCPLAMKQHGAMLSDVFLDLAWIYSENRATTGAIVTIHVRSQGGAPTRLSCVGGDPLRRGYL